MSRGWKLIHIKGEHMRKRQKLNDPKDPFSARIVVDLGFDDKMNDKVCI